MIDTMETTRRSFMDVKEIDKLTLLFNKLEQSITDATLDFASRKLKDLSELVEIRRRKKAKRK